MILADTSIWTGSGGWRNLSGLQGIRKQDLVLRQDPFETGSEKVLTRTLSTIASPTREG